MFLMQCGRLFMFHINWIPKIRVPKWNLERKVVKNIVGVENRDIKWGRTKNNGFS
jgi:hypothetical protein